MSGYAGTPSFPAVEAHTEHRVLVRRDGGPIVPSPPDPGDLACKYGVQAPAKDFEATLLGPNPKQGDSTLGTLSQVRSPRSESICPVEHQVLVRRDGGPIVSTPPDPRDLAGKYGVQAPAKDFKATLLGPNPTPGDSDQVTLSKDRSPRSESICLVERSSSCDTGSNARLAMKGSVQQSSVNRPKDSEHVPVIPGPGSGLMSGTDTRYPVSGTRFHRPLLVNRVL